jgi:beta-glucosidase
MVKHKFKKLILLLTPLLIIAVSPMNCQKVTTNEWNDLNRNGEKDPYEDTNLTIEERATDLLSRMTLEEKIKQLSGDPTLKIHGITKPDAFTTYSNERLGIPPIRCVDTPHGVRWGNATFFPVPIGLGSTWEPLLVEEIAVVIGKEARAKGRDMALAPCMNLIRDPRGGRVFETFSEDPYMLGKMGAAYVRGVQSQKVIATPKHYICNNAEDIRQQEDVVFIDERTMREVYLPFFKEAIKEAGSWSTMCAYNGINGEYLCYNEHLLRDILKDEWGFKGFVVSDWGATHSTISSINAGMDLEMPFTQYYGEQLLEAVNNGEVSEETIDDAVKRILKAKFWTGAFEKEPEINREVIETREHIELALKAARKSIVLLQNEVFLLPFDKTKIRSIAVIGPNAKEDFRGQGGSSAVTSTYAVSILEGIKKKVGDRVEVRYAKGCDVGEERELRREEITPEEFFLHTEVQEQFQEAVEVARSCDVVVLVVGLNGRIESEGKDRKYLEFPGFQERLIGQIIMANRNTAVILMGGTPLTTTMIFWGRTLLEQAPAVLEVWYPGQEGGTAVADVLFGDYNPGGKLPMTFPRSTSDLPEWGYDYTEDYTEGRGYRYFDKKGIEPLFPFGHGLSYTEFEYSNFEISPEESSDGKVTIALDVKNIGDMEGDEVVQLYIHDEQRSTNDQPVKELKGFKRITLNPGESKTVEFNLTPEHFAFHDEDINFVIESGKFDVMVGSSSRDIRLKGELSISRDITVISNEDLNINPKWTKQKVRSML